jgi:hypothetical protein
MEQWMIRKIRPKDAASMSEISESWPPASVFTLQNTLTGELRNITCCGAGLLDSLIAAGRFDDESATSVRGATQPPTPGRYPQRRE